MKKFSFLILFLSLTILISCYKESNVGIKKQSTISSNRDYGPQEDSIEKTMIQLNRECLAKALSIVLKDHTLRNDIIELHKTVPKGYDGFFLNEVKDQRTLINNTKTLTEILQPHLNCSGTPDVLNFLCEKDPLVIIMIFNPLKNYIFNNNDLKVFLPQDNIEELPSLGFSMPYFENGLKNNWEIKADPSINVFVVKTSERARINLKPSDKRKILYSFNRCGTIINVLYYAPARPRGGPNAPSGGGDECPREDLKKTEYFEEFYSEDDSEGCCLKGDADFRMHFIWGTIGASNEILSMQTDDHAFGWDEDESKDKWVAYNSKIINWNPGDPVKDSKRMKYYLVEEDSGKEVQIEVGYTYEGASAKVKIDVTDNHDYIGSEIVEWCSPLLQENKIRSSWDCIFKSTMK